jgi:hypothetical protein
MSLSNATVRVLGVAAATALLLSGIPSALHFVSPAQAQNAPAAQAAAPADDIDARSVALGKSVWQTKIGCNQCHGWSGSGLPDDPRMPAGANLRKTALTHDQMVEVIKCGRPGTQMPHFDARAYADKRCYNSTAADLGDQVPQPFGAALIPREMDALADYITVTMKGKGPASEAECVAYYGTDTAYCKSIGTGQPAAAPVPPPAPGNGP